jgi:hypothetical protein
MKQYTHAWLALKAVGLLESYQGLLKPPHDKDLKEFLDFINFYPATFVRGAWFPDMVIKDNVLGGHTWKYFLDPINGRVEQRRPPAHNQCLAHVAGDLNQKVSLDLAHSSLPDRCEALGQMIRDTILITNYARSGDVVAFNNSQVALSFLMLAHYVCDAHVPVHCDRRDFDIPSQIHPDLEAFWEGEVKKYYKISKNGQEFVTDENGSLELATDLETYKNSILYQCDQILAQTRWQAAASADKNWNAYLGKGNNNFWDYEVSVCLVSFFTSLCMFPQNPPPGVDYNTLKIMESSPFKESVLAFSPKILADAINSVALIWLASWERWKLLTKVVPAS